jgi:hypothetical protein
LLFLEGIEVGEHRSAEVTGLQKLLVTAGHLSELTLARLDAKVDPDVTLSDFSSLKTPWGSWDTGVLVLCGPTHAH